MRRVHQVMALLAIPVFAMALIEAPWIEPYKEALRWAGFALGYFAKTGELIPGTKRPPGRIGPAAIVLFLLLSSCATTKEEVREQVKEGAACWAEGIGSQIPGVIACLATNQYPVCLTSLAAQAGREAVVCAARVVAEAGTPDDSAHTLRAASAIDVRQMRANAWLQEQEIK